eukprot:5314463-Pyramimonas_sp.AAC.1
MQWAPCRHRASGAISQALRPARSLLAGCFQNVDISKVALWDVLEDAHARVRHLALETWVDDL